MKKNELNIRRCLGESIPSNIIYSIGEKYKSLSEKRNQRINRIKKWITYHGLSFNINPNLNYYKKINACGLKNYSSTSLNELGVKLKINKFDSKFSELFIRELKRL